jgi:alpha-glucosidase
MPVLFAGDEFGLVGADGEASRTPMPWGTESAPAVAARLGLYRELIGLRRQHSALATGGLRWVHVDENTLVFVRESADESVLVLASTTDADITLPPAALLGTERAEALFGDAALAAGADGSAGIRATGATFAAWVLPGVDVPEPGDSGDAPS